MYDNKIIQQQQEISKIKRLIKKAKSRIISENKKACSMEYGMTKPEVLSIIGNPTTIRWGSCRWKRKDALACDGWYYGTVNLDFKNELLKIKKGCY